MLLHVLTQKGRGFQPALDRQKKFHGLGPYDPGTGQTVPAGLPTYSEVFAKTLVELARKTRRSWPLPRPCRGTGVDLFGPHHPRRYFDVASQRNMRWSSLPACDQGVPAGLRHLFNVFAAGFPS